MHLNLVYWNSLHPKKNPFYILFQQHIFKVKSNKQKLKTFTIGKLGLLKSVLA